MQDRLQNRPQCCDGKTRWASPSQTVERTLNSPKPAGRRVVWGPHSAHRAFYGHVKESIRKHWPTYRHWSGLVERIGDLPLTA